MTNTLTALVAAATLATAAAGVPTTANARCAGCLGRHWRTTARSTARLRVLSRLCRTAAGAQLQLVPHADL
jgi:hypothetical protein